jgi:hypothetical protein
VAVKKEHVIEDARNLKHLITAITEEKDLLGGIPAPPPTHVEPHWGVKQDDTASTKDPKAAGSLLRRYAHVCSRTLTYAHVRSRMVC